MIYAIVTEYTNGHTAVQYVDQKAVPASKANPTMFHMVDPMKNMLYIDYAKAIHPERKIHIVDWENVEIPLDGVKTITVHNTDEIGGEYEPTPIRVYYPE